MRTLALAFVAVVIAGLPPRADAGRDSSVLIHPPFRHSLGFRKVTPLHVFLYLGARTRFDEPGAIAAVKLRSEDDPRTARDDDELTVFGLNAGRCQVLYNTSLTSADLYGACGAGEGQFRGPSGIAADEEGNVFVADPGNDRIVRLAYRDRRLRFVRNLSGTGPGEGRFSRPSGVAVGASGTLYVADTGNDRIVLTTPAGAFVGSFSGDAAAGVTLDGPSAVAVVEAADEWTALARDAIVAVDRGGTRILSFARDGRLIATARSEALPFPNARFHQVAIDFYGSVYATDTGRSQIHKLDAALTYVASHGGREGGRSELDEPRGITIWRRFGQVFVTERTGAQYFWIGTEVRDLEARVVRPPGGPAEIELSYTLVETSRVTVELLGPRGEVVRTLLGRRRRPIGRNAERLEAPGVAAGRYTLRVMAAPTYSAGSHFQDTAETAIQL
ncbi:MAG: NHL repeat-containing protein [Candidatus Eisenbacteria bacterium]|nr:NHL repeat-containing protein [Candidatus Eisenbacteria bacterium]